MVGNSNNQVTVGKFLVGKLVPLDDLERSIITLLSDELIQLLEDLVLLLLQLRLPGSRVSTRTD